MTPDQYTPLYAKVKKEYALKLQEVEVRRELLKQQQQSSANVNAKEYKSSSIEHKLNQLDQEEAQTIKYFRDEIVKAEEKYTVEIAKAEDKLKNYKIYCMDNIERIKDKNQIKRSALELKKNSTEVEFDESDDKILTRLKLELANLKEASDRADVNMANYEAVEVKRKKAEQLDRQFLEHIEKVRADALAKDKKEQEDAKRYNQVLEEAEAEDAKRYAADQEKRRAERQEQITEENRALYKQRTELQKVWSDKQHKKYYKISRDERLGFLNLSIDSVLAKLN
jgi:hypothetical protein